jgi:hypothetical protein
MERQSIFLALAAVMYALVIVFAIYSVISLASNLNNALNAPLPGNQMLKFDIKGFEDLKLIR